MCWYPYIYLLSFNQRCCQSRYRSAIDHVMGACCRTRDVNTCRKIHFSHHCTAEIEQLCIILYMWLYKGRQWGLCVKVW